MRKMTLLTLAMAAALSLTACGQGARQGAGQAGTCLLYTSDAADE